MASRNKARDYGGSVKQTKTSRGSNGSTSRYAPVRPTNYLNSKIEDKKCCTKIEYLTYLKSYMVASVNDVIPLSQAQANRSELAHLVKAGAEKIITKNSENYSAKIDAQRLNHNHRLVRVHVYLQLLDEASKALDDIAAGHVADAATTLQLIKLRQAFTTSS